MCIPGGMAGITRCRRAHEHTIGMALSTGGVDMRSGQREGRQIMIEGGRLPRQSGVTSRAVRSILATVMIISRMAGITRCGRAFELKILMTTTANNSCVLTGQLEDGVGVIKVTRLPTIGCMAGFALSAKRTAMRIITAMA